MKKSIFLFLFPLVFLNCSKKTGDGPPTPDQLSSHTWYVAASGQDNYARSAGSPFKTINHALSLAVPGHTVMLRGGTHNEQISLPPSGHPRKNITAKAYPGQKPPIHRNNQILTGHQAPR